MKKVLYGLIVSGLLLFASFDIAAKSCKKCAVPTPKQALMGSALVFSGKAAKITGSGTGKIIEFRVDRYWKGNRKKTVKVRVEESMRFESFFEEGKKYFVYAEKDNGNAFYISRCSRSTELENAKDDIKQLGSGKKPK